MRLDKILENIKAADTAISEKVASVSPAATVSREQLLAALNDSTGVKTANAFSSPAGDLMKIASEVADVEKEAAFKEAQLLGHAFADAVVTRVGQWQQAAGATKVAYENSGEGDFDKFASENPDMIKEAAASGYIETRQNLEKFAADEYDRGYSETMQAVQKIAAEEFAKAAQLTGNILNYLSGAA